MRWDLQRVHAQQLRCELRLVRRHRQVRRLVQRRHAGELRAGVRIVRRYVAVRRLVQCCHAGELRAGVRIVRRYVAVQRCVQRRDTHQLRPELRRNLRQHGVLRRGGLYIPSEYLDGRRRLRGEGDELQRGRRHQQRLRARLLQWHDLRLEQQRRMQPGILRIVLFRIQPWGQGHLLLRQRIGRLRVLARKGERL